MSTMAQDGQVQAQPVKKKHLSARGFINSPWILVAVALLIGGFYLVLHPEYIVAAMKYPYAVAFLASLIPVVFVIKLIINFFSVIEQWIRLQFEKARQAKKGFFFEIVTAVFMFVSVCEAGPFFNDIQHNMLSGALGYITVFAFDLIAVVCIDSRRKEKAKGGTMAGVYLTGVIFCAAVSMVANLYSALINFHAPAATNFPELLKAIAPYVGIMFPVMIIFLAFSRDADIEVDDAETYRKQQQKRVDFLAVRREILAAITREMEQIDLLKKREFVLKSWFFTKKKMNLVIEVVTGKVEQEIATLKQELNGKEQTITSQVAIVQSLVKQCQEYQETIALQFEQLSRFQEKMTLSYNNFQTSIVSNLPQPEPLDYAKLAEQIVPFFPQPVQPDYEQFTKRIVNLEETIGELSLSVGSLENEPIRRNYPDIEDETEDETFYVDGEELDDLDRDTDPNQMAVNQGETNGSDNITFLHSTAKTKSETKARTKSGRGAAASRAARIIKNNPNITPAELARKAKITSQYAGRLLSQKPVASETV